MILVTGGTGLVGSHLLLELTRKNDRIKAIHRPSSNIQFVLELFALYLKEPRERFEKIEWIPCDITDIHGLLEAFEEVDLVYHTAAEVTFKPGEVSRLMNNNVSGTANVVNACLEKKIKKLCFVSSTAALGEAPKGEEITEDLLWTNSKQRSAYSVSKFNSEMEVWRGMAEGLDAVIINPSIIIGPGNWNKSSPYLFTAVWKGMKFYTRGVTGYVDIRDVVNSMITLMEGDFSGERFTISSENLSYQQVLDMIAGALGKKPPRLHAAPIIVSLGWRIDWLLSKLTGKSRLITRDAAKASSRKAFFSNRKIREATDIEFRLVQKSIEETAPYFLRAHAGSS